MSNLKLINDDEEFTEMLKTAANDELVVIDFYTTWCRPCKNMEPVLESMAAHYPKAHFMKVDADKCFNTAMTYKVTGVPFFVIYFNKRVVETIQGANPEELELKIKAAETECRKAAATMERSSVIGGRGPGQGTSSSGVKTAVSSYGKLGSVAPFINAETSFCLNDLSPTSFHNFLGGKKLVSGKGTGKMLIVYSFTQKMMLQSFKIKGNAQTGPKVLRFFVNHPKVLDFNVGTTLAPSQEVTLGLNDLSGERAIELRSGSFQVVTNVQIFVTMSQTKDSRLEIESLELFGAPVIATQPLLDSDSMIPALTKILLPVPTTADSDNSNKPSAPPVCNKDSGCLVPGLAELGDKLNALAQSVSDKIEKEKQKRLSSHYSSGGHHHSGNPTSSTTSKIEEADEHKDNHHHHNHGHHHDHHRHH